MYRATSSGAFARGGGLLVLGPFSLVLSSAGVWFRDGGGGVSEWIVGWMDGWMDGSWMNNVRICPKDDLDMPTAAWEETDPAPSVPQQSLCLGLVVVDGFAERVFRCFGSFFLASGRDASRLEATAASSQQPTTASLPLSSIITISLDSGLVATGLGHRIEGSSIWHCAVFGRELPPQAFSGAVAVLALKGGARSERPDPKRRRAGQRTRSTLALALSGACSGGGVHSINAHCCPLLPTARCLLLLWGRAA